MARVLWIVALAVLAALVFYGMRRGWVSRARRQAAWLPGFPPVPGDIGAEVLPVATGLYVGTTRAGDWQDRIAVGDIGHRAQAVAKLGAAGLLLERAGSSPLWIPVSAFRDARVDHKLANKVVPGAGMLVVTWQLGEHPLDTGFRGDDKKSQADWAEAVRAMAPTARDEAESPRREEQ